MTYIHWGLSQMADILQMIIQTQIPEYKEGSRKDFDKI